MNIDPFLTPAGIAAAQRLGIPLNEVIDVLYSPTSITIEIEATRALFIVGIASSGLITVVCDLRSRNTTIYEITDVRPASAVESRAWRSKQNG